MKKLLMLFMILPLIEVSAQWDFSASMGLDFKSISSYRDYINFNFAPSNNKVKSFSSSVNFALEVGHQTSSHFQLGIEYSLLIDSYTTPIGTGGIYDISYLHHRPSLIGYYVLSGTGYKFKFGGGFGVRFISLIEKIITEADYSASGYGVVLKGEGNTLLGGNFYVLIGLDLRYDVPGEVSNKNNQKIVNNVIGDHLNLNSISIGIKLGISYLL